MKNLVIVKPNEISEWREAIWALDQRKIKPSGRFCRWLARNIREGSEPRFVYRCVCAADHCKSAKVTSALLSRINRSEDHHLVRGVCLEMLAWRASWYSPWTRQDKKVHNAVLKCLKDQHPNVRFWACYAAAILKMCSAQSALLQLRGDQGQSIMGWTVEYEAGEALKAIRGDDPWDDDRMPGENPYESLWSLNDQKRS